MNLENFPKNKSHLNDAAFLDVIPPLAWINPNREYLDQNLFNVLAHNYDLLKWFVSHGHPSEVNEVIAQILVDHLQRFVQINAEYYYDVAGVLLRRIGARWADGAEANFVQMWERSDDDFLRRENVCSCLAWNVIHDEPA